MSFFGDAIPDPPAAPEPVERPEWLGPAHGVVPVLSPQWAVLLKSQEFALVVDQFLVYPNGVSFRVLLHFREANLDRVNRLSAAFGGPNVVHYGCQLADGTKWTNGDLSWHSDDDVVGPVISGGGGGGNSWTSYAGHWIWPLPPPGKITFVAEWPSQRLSQRSVEIDADELRALSAAAQVLWPSVS